MVYSWFCCCIWDSCYPFEMLTSIITADQTSSSPPQTSSSPELVERLLRADSGYCDVVVETGGPPPIAAPAFSVGSASLNQEEFAASLVSGLRSKAGSTACFKDLDALALDRYRLLEAISSGQTWTAILCRKSTVLFPIAEEFICLRLENYLFTPFSRLSCCRR